MRHWMPETLVVVLFRASVSHSTLLWPASRKPICFWGSIHACCTRPIYSGFPVSEYSDLPIVGMGISLGSTLPSPGAESMHEITPESALQALETISLT